MWIKFDGKSTYIKIVHFNGKVSIVKTQAIILNKWVDIQYSEGELFINGKKIKKGEPK